MGILAPSVQQHEFRWSLAPDEGADGLAWLGLEGDAAPRWQGIGRQTELGRVLAKQGELVVVMCIDRHALPHRLSVRQSFGPLGSRTGSTQKRIPRQAENPLADLIAGYLRRAAGDGQRPAAEARVARHEALALDERQILDRDGAGYGGRLQQLLGQQQ